MQILKLARVLAFALVAFQVQTAVAPAATPQKCKSGYANLSQKIFIVVKPGLQSGFKTFMKTGIKTGILLHACARISDLVKGKHYEVKGEMWGETFRLSAIDYNVGERCTCPVNVKPDKSKKRI